MLSDRFIGSVLLALNTAFIVYYMLWIGFMPFVDQDHFTQAFFLPREYGLLLAALIMTTGLGLSVTLASVHTIRRTGYSPESVAEASEASLANAEAETKTSPVSSGGGHERIHSNDGTVVDGDVVGGGGDGGGSGGGAGSPHESDRFAAFAFQDSQRAAGTRQRCLADASDANSASSGKEGERRMKETARLSNGYVNGTTSQTNNLRMRK